jgi:hypothetical protein
VGTGKRGVGEMIVKVGCEVVTEDTSSSGKVSLIASATISGGRSYDERCWCRVDGSITWVRGGYVGKLGEEGKRGSGGGESSSLTRDVRTLWMPEATERSGWSGGSVGIGPNDPCDSPDRGRGKGRRLAMPRVHRIGGNDGCDLRPVYLGSIHGG